MCAIVFAPPCPPSLFEPLAVVAAVAVAVTVAAAVGGSFEQYCCCLELHWLEARRCG